MRGYRAALLAGVSLLALTPPGLAYNDIQTGAVGTPQVVVSTAELDSTTTAGAAITGLAIPLLAGKTYECEADVRTTEGTTTGGPKIGLVATSGLSATSISYTVRNFAAAGVVTSVAETTLGNYGGSAALALDNIIRGVIIVNAAGTINVYGEQNTQYTTTSTKFLVNSSLECTRIN
jgi:hypothetical protein